MNKNSSLCAPFQTIISSQWNNNHHIRHIRLSKISNAIATSLFLMQELLKGWLLQLNKQTGLWNPFSDMEYYIFPSVKVMAFCPSDIGDFYVNVPYDFHDRTHLQKETLAMFPSNRQANYW